jgi:hypothetical protein
MKGSIDMKKRLLNPPIGYLTTDELSRRWGGSPAPGTIRNWRMRGHGPRWRSYGKFVIYSLKDVKQWEKNFVRGK